MPGHAAVSSADIENVRRGVEELRPLVNGMPSRLKAVVVEVDGGRVSLGADVMRSIVRVLEAVASEDDKDEITPQEAAAILGMSRPSVMRLVRKGILRARMVGSHHRLARSEVLAYKGTSALVRQEARDTVARLSGEHDF